jgi:localization factor PodJL
MKSNIPWSVKGIDPEAREAAKIAARRAGMTLGEWLNSLILQSGELPEGLAAQLVAEAAAEDARGHGGEASDEDEAELQSRLETLNRRLDQSERQSALAVSGIDQSIERLASTIESSRRLLATGDVAPKSTVNELASRVERLQSQLEQVSVQGRAGLDGRTLVALEKAIAGVAAHIEKSDRRNAELVQSVEEAITELAQKVGHAETSSHEAISRIDHTLDRLNGRIDTTESEQRRAGARLNERLAQLDERVATSLVQREAGIGGIERRLGGLESRLENVQGQIKAQIDEVRMRPAMSPDALSRKEFEDWSRRQAADQGSSQASARQSLSNLEARIAVLTERADRLQREGGTQNSAAVDRVSESARQAGERADAAAKRAGEATQAVKSELGELTQKLDRTNHTATETMQALEGVLRSLTRRLDMIDGRGSKGVPEAPVIAPVVVPPVSVAPIAASPPAPEPAPERVAAIAAERKIPSRSPGWLWRDEPAAAGGDLIGRSAPEPAAQHGAEADDEPQIQGDDHDTDEVHQVFAPTDEDGHEHTGRARPQWGDDEHEEHAPAHGEPAGRGGRDFDLSNLMFNLDGARERQPDDQGSPAEPAFTPRPSEPASGRSEDSDWLEQARRAAKAAGPGERASDADGQKTSARSTAVKLGIAVLIALAIAVVIFTYVVPRLTHKRAATPDVESTAIPATTTAKPPAGGQKAITTDKHDQTPAPPPSTATAPNPTPEGAPPREDDLGSPLPSDAKANADSLDQGQAQSPQAEAAPAASTAPSVKPPQGIAAPTAPPVAQISKPTPDEALKAAAEGGKAQAQYSYALALKAKGNTEAALDVMKRAAAQGLGIAERQLGVWYEQGDGVNKDLTEAGKWYLHAAQAGDVQAMHNLGFFYAQGFGGLQRDGATAEHWFKSAASRGLVASQVNLAIVYSQADSFGLPAGDPQARAADAYFWAAIAGAHGDEQAAKLRDQIARDLKPEAKASIDKKVAAFRPQPLDLMANGGFDTSAQAFLPADQQAPLGRDEIISIQKMLNELGYKVGPADGKLGPSLEKAIRAFQAAYHLPETGVADQNLLAALEIVPR